ncbi:amidohydrolase [Leifsonia shinshuensis]|uniref:amidohydrolase n=1 Tax=Leifsonia shinshuensis TaxID=150026 RepID=UPI001F50B45D|nr:amidohydrolase [Leifsonia shinshuensis]MCI0158383.1 amidohydrolase [Leifsonia shinshuensis]
MTSLHITNARIALGDGRWQDGGVLVRDGVIAAVGPDADLATRRDPDTAVRDARGVSLLPGFHDTHVHPPMAGNSLLGIDLMPVHGADAYLRIVADYADAHPELETIVGVGWYGDVFPGGLPTRGLLDAVVPDRPVILTSHDGHGVWVNTRALEAAGVGHGAADPTGGRFVRNPRGELTGVLLDTAMQALDPILPEPAPGSLEEAILTAQRRLHSVGVTTWHDAAVGKSELGPDSLDAYLNLEAQGALTARVVLCQWWDRDRGLEQLADLEARRTRVARTRRISAHVVKIMQDGMIENHTAALLDDYSDAPGVRGDSFLPPEELAAVVAELDAHGFDVHLHAVGDRAVRECLDALAHARARNGSTGGRHQLAHLDVVDTADLGRFAALDVTVNAQLLWARTDVEIVERKLPMMGEDRAGRHFPFETLRAHGARIVAGSDWPVSDPNPLWAMHTGTTRLAPSTDPHATGLALTDPLLAAEVLPFATVLDAYTGTAAWVGRLEATTGRLEAGLAADLVLLDRDISGGEGLDTARVTETWVAGRCVYTAET